MSQQQLESAPKVEVKKGQYGYYLQLPDYELSIAEASIAREFTAKESGKKYLVIRPNSYVNVRKPFQFKKP